MLLVVLVCITLVAVPLLMACTIRNPTPTPVPTPALPSTIATPSSITLPSGNEVKIDSTLLDVAAAYNAGGQAAAEAKARETGLLNEQDELRLTLVLTDTNTQPVVDKVKELGGKVTATAENLVEVLFPLQTAISSLGGTSGQNFLQELASLTTVQEVRVTPLPRSESFSYPTGTTIEELQPLIQALIVEGVAITGADRWHNAGLKGKGVKIGIIDGGFAGYESLLGKELPRSVTLKTFLSNGREGRDVHGTAVAEIVHAMAPEAELYLCPIESDATYIQAVKYLVDEAKVDVIQQSQGWHDQRGDGNDFRSRQVDYAHENGVVYVKSAGNEADSHYSGTFNPGATGRHQFASGKERLRVQGPSDNVILLHLIWDAWEGDSVNYDLYLVDEAGTKVASSRNVQQGSAKPPYETIEYRGRPGVRYYAVIEAVNTTQAVRLDLFGKNTALENVGAGSTPVGSISNPGEARGAITVGAVNFENDKLEDYSGQGPTADGRLKPNIVAPARVTTVSYDGEPFAGTSASTPHASGAAALVIGAQPEASPDEVRAFLEKNARDMEEQGPENKTGFGRLALGPAENAGTRVQPEPSAAAASNGPARSDDFGNPQSGLKNADETTYKEGRYVIAPNAPNRAAWATYGGNYSNATVEATVQLTSPAGGAAGLVFWHTGGNDYYAFLVTNDGFYQVARLQGGRWSALTPWQQAPTLKANEPNALGVQINGKQITLLANGQPLGTTQAPSAGSGRVGFIATNFAQPGTSAAFDNFKVTPGP
jgi:hypothetical protein